MRKNLGLILVLLGILPSAHAADIEPIRIQIGGEPSTLDPARVVDQYGIGILRNIVEGLFKLDHAGKLQYGLASAHTVSADGLTYRIKLRPDARWSDGRAVSIDDCIFGLRHAIDPKTNSPDADSFFAIRNARAIFSGHAKPETLGVRQEGDELVIDLERADSALPLELTLPAASPLRRDIFTANNGRWNPRDPVTGGYRISLYHPTNQIRLEPNPFNQKPGQRQIIYDVLPEEITALNLFETGRLDVISTVTPTEIERLREKGLVQTAPSTTVYYFSFNVARAPFNDVDWRRAVASSVDRSGLTRVLRGAFEATTSYLPKSIDGALPYHPMEFPSSVEKIRALASKPRIRLAFSMSSANKLIAEKLQYDLEKNLGLKVSLEPMELKSLLSRLAVDPPEMYILGKSAMYDDPLNHLNAFTNSPEPNFSHYASGEFEQLVDRIKTTQVGPARTQLAQRANELLVEKDVVVVPLALRLQVFGVSRSARNFEVNPYQVIQLDRLEK